MFYWFELIHKYGAVQQYSVDRHEQTHKPNLKDGWNTSNHNLNCLPQVFTFHHRILCLEIRELNVHVLTQRQETSAATCNVLSSKAYVAASLSSQSYTKPEFIRPHNPCDGLHSHTIIKDFRILLNNMQYAMHHVAQYRFMHQLIKHKCCNKMYILDEQLCTIELCIYHGIKVQLEGLEGKYIPQICRYTSSQSWHGENRQNDWLWVKQCLVRCYGVLIGHLLWQLQRLFNMYLLNNDGAFVEYSLALAITTIPENSCKLDPNSKFVQVWEAPAAGALQVFSVGNIFGGAHVIPEIAIISNTGNRRNEWWIGNSHINLPTSNDAYT